MEPSDRGLLIPTRCPFQYEKQVGLFFAAAIPIAIVAWAAAPAPDTSKIILAWLNLFAVFAGAAAAFNTIVGEKKAPNVTFALALFAITPVVCLAVAKIVGVEGAQYSAKQCPGSIWTMLGVVGRLNIESSSCPSGRGFHHRNAGASASSHRPIFSGAGLLDERQVIGVSGLVGGVRVIPSPLRLHLGRDGCPVSRCPIFRQLWPSRDSESAASKGRS